MLSADVVAAIPGNRSVGTLLNAVPGLIVNDGALAASPTMTFFAARGGPINEGRMAINGMTIAAPFNGGGVSTYILDSVNVDEVSVAVAGGLGESDIGGPVMNLVPRSGGNAFRGSGVHQQRGRLVTRQQPERRAAAPSGHHGDARHHQLLRRERLVRRPDQARSTLVLWQLSQPRDGSGGPGRRRQRERLRRLALGLGGRPERHGAASCRGASRTSGRITAQVSAKHRVSFNQEYQRRCEGSPLKLDSDNGCNTRGADWVAAGTGDALSPEANPNYFGNLPYHVNQAIWTAPMTNKLLLEAGFTRFMFRGGTTGRPAPDGIFESDPGDRAVHGDQSGDGPAVCAAGELRLSGGARPPTPITPTRTAGAPRPRTSRGRTR